jgi:hypothetical protein
MKQDPENTIVSFRLPRLVAERYWEVMHKAKSRDIYVSKSAIMLELFGVEPLRLVTPEEIEFFRTGEVHKKGAALRPSSAKPTRVKVGKPIIGGGDKLSPKRKATGSGR